MTRLRGNFKITKSTVSFVPSEDISHINPYDDPKNYTMNRKRSASNISEKALSPPSNNNKDNSKENNSNHVLSQPLIQGYYIYLFCVFVCIPYRFDM